MFYYEENKASQFKDSGKKVIFLRCIYGQLVMYKIDESIVNFSLFFKECEYLSYVTDRKLHFILKSPV